MFARTAPRRFRSAIALAASTTLAACSLDFHRFVPPDGDAGDAQVEARAGEARCTHPDPTHTTHIAACRFGCGRAS